MRQTILVEYIQCRDKVTGKIGSFLAEEDNPGYAVTEIYPTLLALYLEMHKQGLSVGIDGHVYKRSF